MKDRNVKQLLIESTSRRGQGKLRGGIRMNMVDELYILV
jgi:hypothetical protein